VSPFVLDASFAISWIVADERTPLGLKYLRALGDNELEALVPAIWADELANVLIVLERSKRIPPKELPGWIDTLKILPIRIYPASLSESLGEVRVLAKAHKLTLYDARYLHLAMREGIPLATKDRQLLVAAPKVGVKLVQ
jgi:predicted nucleic acid-binding protein